MLVQVSSRFRGPPDSGNGGYVCGILAAQVGPHATVRLRTPPPLETPLAIERTATGARLHAGATLVAEARAGAREVETPEPPTFAEAEAASRRYPGFEEHVFPTCFVCGPARRPGDGLRIFPGAIAGRELVAAPWTPDASLADPDGTVRSEFLWAALDCPGAFACHRSPGQAPVVLGELEARLEGTLRVGEPCIVLAWPLGHEGRKHFAGSALVSSKTGRCAVARATWIELPPA